MEEPKLVGARPIRRAPLHIRSGRALRRFAIGVGATDLSSDGALMMVGLEAIVLSPYWDSAKPPVLTIGVGHTAAAGPPDPATLWHRPQTVGQVIAQFERDVVAYAASVRRAFARPLNQQQFDAAVDFNYHTGRIETANWVKLFNAGRDRDAEQSLIANWRSQPARTEAERQLFFHGVYAGDGTALLVPANDRGRLNWHAAQRISIRPYFPHGWRLAA